MADDNIPSPPIPQPPEPPELTHEVVQAAIDRLTERQKRAYRRFIQSVIDMPNEEDEQEEPVGGSLLDEQE